jgi:hypothetical protein
MEVNIVQGIYFLITGLWPVFNINSFEKISGRKTDKWLVKTFGLLVAAVGVVLITSSDVKLLGITSAVAVGAPEIYYSLRGRISNVYTIDGIIEFIFVVWWILK